MGVSPGQAPRDPEELQASTPPASGEIAAATSMGPAHLTVSELESSLDYYREGIGLEVLEQANGSARLGAGEQELLALVEQPGAPPRTATRASTASPCSCRSARTSLAGSRTSCETASRWSGSPTTSSARRSTSATPTGTGSRCTGIDRARSGRARSARG